MSHLPDRLGVRSRRRVAARGLRQRFIFPDDEELIQAEFAKNIPFALAVARVRRGPGRPGLGGRPDDAGLRGRRVRRLVRHGPSRSPSIARRALQQRADALLVNGGPTRLPACRSGAAASATATPTTTTTPSSAARSPAPGRRPVEVWFTGASAGQARSPARTSPTRVHTDIGGEVLILAAEDVTGLSPAQAARARSTPTTYAAALAAAGYTSDVYDFDVKGRKAPHHLGVLSHYKAVVWETGDDIILRAPGQVAGTAAEGGARHRAGGARLPQRGRQAARERQVRLFAQGANGAYCYNPFAPPECTTPGRTRACRCSTTSSSTGWAPTPTSTTAARTPDGEPVPAAGCRGRVHGLQRHAQRRRARRPTRATRPRSCRRRASCRRHQFPQFASRRRWTGCGRDRRAVRPVHR